MKDPHELAMKQFAKSATWMQQTGGYAKDMTLRDWFAGLAMQGFLGTVKVGCPDDLIAVDAYNLANAMLKERNK